MEYFGDARHHDLDADAEGEERDHFIDDDAAVVADFSDDLLSLCKKQVEDRAHQYDDDADDRVVEQATDPVAADAGRSHHRENDRDAAGADADRKGNGIEYPGFDRPQTDGVGVSFRYAAGRSVGVAEPLQRRATDEQAAAQLDDRQRQVEEREYEMPDGQTSQADQQVVGDDSSDDGHAGLLVESRQESVHEKSRPYGIRHRKQRHKGGYEHEDRAFDHFEFVLPVNLRYGNSVGSAADDFDRNSKSGAKRGYRKRSPSGERKKKGQPKAA